MLKAELPRHGRPADHIFSFIAPVFIMNDRGCAANHQDAADADRLRGFAGRTIDATRTCSLHRPRYRTLKADLIDTTGITVSTASRVWLALLGPRHASHFASSPFGIGDAARVLAVVLTEPQNDEF